MIENKGYLMNTQIEETEENNTNDTASFDQFGLNEALLKAINDVGYETPSPIQLKTIPLLLIFKVSFASL